MRIHKYNITLKPIKTFVSQEKINILGHIVDKDGINIDPNKVKAIGNIAAPTTLKRLRSFIGMCSYHRQYIKNFADIVGPLHDLLKRKSQFIWTNDCNKAFINLKKALTSAPVLSFPIVDVPFILETDASDKAMGALLKQNGSIIECASKIFTKTENNYSTVEKELLAVAWAISKFKYYLYGITFTVITDHRPLVYIRNSKRLSKRQFKWIQQLENYNFEIIYREGKFNYTADILLRPQFIPLTLSNFVPVSFDVQTYHSNNNDCQKALCSINEITKDNIYYRFKKNLIIKDAILYFKKGDILVPVVPPKLISKILEYYHTNYKLKLVKTDKFNFLWQIDICDPFTESNNGFKYVINMVDHYSEWVESCPVFNISADIIVDVKYLHIITRYGPPLEIHTDLGKQFESNLFKELCKRFEIKRSTSEPYRHQQNGAKLVKLGRIFKRYIVIRSSITSQKMENLAIRDSINGKINDVSTIKVLQLLASSFMIVGSIKLFKALKMNYVCKNIEDFTKYNIRYPILFKCKLDSITRFDNQHHLIIHQIPNISILNSGISDPLKCKLYSIKNLTKNGELYLKLQKNLLYFSVVTVENELSIFLYKTNYLFTKNINMELLKLGYGSLDYAELDKIKIKGKIRNLEKEWKKLMKNENYAISKQLGIWKNIKNLNKKKSFIANLNETFYKIVHYLYK
ncbi:hypothetical protein A3Q56_01372 [Intoshia linei]|uniref:Integrase catalytic domain-containing protein n=1 Tax=Intoshia linei TaxID=1819745 RepID=A0A177B9F4_9BILA|nr:hypothetical protein A3Q56_01372 [Intoshia linei]